ncbi:TPA: 30S ribosomal protein S4e [Candidatus Woesearchaeota archaeon]|nr:30S ribosomal protein S4e [Candidatus Woesearchaeota archaeon]HII65768.1 30S ribosomal protein S4e [Candidatus Woesearchaeota archaeon]
MAKRHLKRMAVPRTWPVERKSSTFIYRPSPGAHSFDEGMSLGTFLKEVFRYARTNREARRILHQKTVLVDGKRRKDEHLIVGLFDIIEFPEADTRFRITINTNGKIDAVAVDKKEAALKPCRITGKSMVKGKVQLNLSDGRNILVDKDGYRTGDTLLIGLPSQDIRKHLRLDKKAAIFLTGGKHLGHIGTVEGISGDRLMYRTEDGAIQETKKEYAFVIGEGKPALTISASQDRKSQDNS